MEGRTRKAGHGSPERSKMRAEVPLKHQHQLQQLGRKIPVVYYLCRNRHLEHPHFIEVPTSSPEGLYLRDVISRLNGLRGKGMAAMYSWSCKRSYKNGFVWHDLSGDDPILPSNGNEYVLKGSELLDTSPSDRPHHAATSTWSQTAKHLQHDTLLPSRSLETSPSSSGVVIKEVKPPPPPQQRRQQHPSLPPAPLPASGPEVELQLSPTLRRRSFSSRNISPDSQLNPSWGVGGCSPPGIADYKVYKANGAADASTQTEDKGGCARREAAPPPPPPPCTRTMGVSTDDGALELDFDEARQLRTSSEISGDEISPPPTSSSASSSGGKTETLESLIRADARKMSTFRILEEEEVLPPAGGKLRPTNVLMQLITCGSISVKDHHSFGLVPTYKPSFSQVRFPSPMLSNSRILGELDCLSENPRMVGLRALEDKEYFSGSLIETKKHKELAEADLVPVLKRSSSYNADRSCKSPDPIGDKAKATDSARSKCLPRTIKITSNKHPKNETMKSPISDGPRISSAGLDGTRSKGGSKRFNDAASLKGSSLRLESFREDKEKVIKIEERLTSGARVVIHSTAPCEDSEDSSSS